MRKPSEQQANSTFERILESFLKELRADPEETTIQQYQEKYPQFSDQIATHFPGVLIAEKLRLREKPEEIILNFPCQIGKFVLTGKLGHGGMATVFDAIHSDLEMEFAVKLIDVAKTSLGHVARFKREAKAIAMLHHSGITPICDFGQHENYMYVVMRKVNGITFHDLFTDPTAINSVDNSVESIAGNWDLLAMLFCEVAKIVSYIHTKGLIHRDIKPSNLMIDDDSNVWVTDFGLVEQIAPDSNEISTSCLVGTPCYVAPECFDGTVGFQSDIYSFGVTLFELAAGTPAAKILGKRLGASTVEGLPKVNEFNSQIPKPLADIIDKACEPRLSKRYSKIEFVGKDLQNFVLRGKRGESFLSRWFQQR